MIVQILNTWLTTEMQRTQGFLFCDTQREQIVYVSGGQANQGIGRP